MLGSRVRASDNPPFAFVVELVDTSVLETDAERRAGSSPARGTIMGVWRNR